MKPHLVLLGLFCLLIQSGCAVLNVSGDVPSLEQINQWVANDEYGRALSALEHIPHNTPRFAAYVNKRTQILVKAAKYERQIQLTAKKDIEKQDWTAALAIYDEALLKYPGSEMLRKQQSVLLKKQHRRVRRLDAEALLAHAQLLYNKLPLSQKNVRQSPINIAAHIKLQNLQYELADMHVRLLAMSRQMLDDSNIKLANQCLLQARQLATNEKSLLAIDVQQLAVKKKATLIKDKKARAASKAKQRKSAKLRAANSARITHLNKEITKLISSSRLQKANRLLQEFAHIDAEHPTYLKLKLRHREKVDQIVNIKMAQGNALYRQEKIEQAKQVWEEALRLDPENHTLRNQIERAQQVLKKLETLRNEQGIAVN